MGLTLQHMTWRWRFDFVCLENIENDPEWKWPDENDLSIKITLSWPWHILWETDWAVYTTRCSWIAPSLLFYERVGFYHEFRVLLGFSTESRHSENALDIKPTKGLSTLIHWYTDSDKFWRALWAISTNLLIQCNICTEYIYSTEFKFINTSQFCTYI